MSSSIVIMARASPLQVKRWVYTLNNYDRETDYKAHYENFPIIQRCVWGYEVAPRTGTHHIQGYLEFNRSQRLNICRTIHPAARWASAKENSSINFRYCCKGGNFEYIGDWSREMGTYQTMQERPLSIPLLIAGLINPLTAAQIKLTKEYADRYMYCEKVASFFNNMKYAIEDFNEFKDVKLYPWQYEVSNINIHFVKVSSADF